MRSPGNPGAGTLYQGPFLFDSGEKLGQSFCFLSESGVTSEEEVSWNTQPSLPERGRDENVVIEQDEILRVRILQTAIDSGSRTDPNRAVKDK